MWEQEKRFCRKSKNELKSEKGKQDERFGPVRCNGNNDKTLIDL